MVRERLKSITRFFIFIKCKYIRIFNLVVYPPQPVTQNKKVAETLSYQKQASEVIPIHSDPLD